MRRYGHSTRRSLKGGEIWVCTSLIVSFCTGLIDTCYGV